MIGYRRALVRADTPDEAAARAALGGHLREGEDFLWLGRPRVRPIDRNRLGRGVITAYVVVVAIVAALGQGLSLGLSLVVGVLVTLACVYGVALLRLRSERARSRIFYGLTKRRVLIIDTSASSFTALDLATLPGLFLMDETAEGDATIYLDPRSIPERIGDKVTVDPNAPPPLLMLPNARLVYERVVEARSALPSDTEDARSAAGDS